MYIGLHVKYRYSSRVLMKLEFFRHIFEKSSNVKFHENPSSWSRVVTCGQTGGETDLTKLIVLLAIWWRCLKSEYFVYNYWIWNISAVLSLLMYVVCYPLRIAILSLQAHNGNDFKWKNFSTINRAIFCSWIRSVRGSFDRLLDCPSETTV